jgi:hypothetical protein
VTGAAFQEHFKDASGFGWDIDASTIRHDWAKLIAGKNAVIQNINSSYVCSPYILVAPLLSK